MAKKTLKSGFQLEGIAPNLLLKDIENTAPFLFKNELRTKEPNQSYLEKLIFYKKNLKQLNNLNLSDYFHLCISAHWATAGTFVPTDVDNQIRKNLWQNPGIAKHINKMADMTIESLGWDYSQVSRRVSYREDGSILISTHEGTWFSVAIGAYCALVQNKSYEKAQEVSEVILGEIKNEEKILIELFERKNHLGLIKTSPLVAHNFGDLDRVMVAWDMHESNSFCKEIYKLGHQLNEKYSKLLVYQGEINKEFTANENHRHMALRKPKCLRKSSDFLIHVGPFLDDWGEIIANSTKLSGAEKAEVIIALYEGFLREKECVGYARALAGILNASAEGLHSFERDIPFDVVKEIFKSPFFEFSKIPKLEFEQTYKDRLDSFTCPKTGIKFS